jgi:hypothetical protein
MRFSLAEIITPQTDAQALIIAGGNSLGLIWRLEPIPPATWPRLSGGALRLISRYSDHGGALTPHVVTTS